MNRDRILELIGPMPRHVPLDPEVLETVECGTFVRKKVRYCAQEGDKVSSYVFLPKTGLAPHPAVFCHHQHTPERVGKAEPAGLEGNPDLAYAKELAERGYVALAPDAFTFGDRRNADDPSGYAYWELATRLVQGKTLLAKVLHDTFVGLDYLESCPEVDCARIGFIGHSYGGRMGIWAAALDHRIKAAVCSCGCISYRHSLTEDTGIQMEFVVPGIAQYIDIVDLVNLIEPNSLLISATEEDKWCRGVAEVFDVAKPRFKRGSLELRMYPGKHHFTQEMREAAYEFLDGHLKRSTAAS